jgi:hypothetical protein
MRRVKADTYMGVRRIPFCTVTLQFGLVNRLFKRMPLGTRPKGRPKTRWKDQVHTDMKELKI